LALVKPEKPDESGVACASAGDKTVQASVTDINARKVQAVSDQSVKNLDGDNAADDKEVDDKEVDSASTPDTATNPTKRVVDEVVALMGEVHEVREEIMARGIPFHTINVLVEMGVHDKLEEQATMCKTALETSKKQHGAAGITAEALDGHLDTLVNLEKDLGHVRRLGRDQGLDMNSINYLTMIIRQNPGDGGEKMINTFLAYAMACEIPLHRIEEIFAEATSGPKSVLPDISRDEELDIAAAARKRLVIDLGIGCALALLALSLLV